MHGAEGQTGVGGDVSQLHGRRRPSHGEITRSRNVGPHDRHGEADRTDSTSYGALRLANARHLEDRREEHADHVSMDWATLPYGTMTKHNTVTLTGLSLCSPHRDPDYVCLTILDLVGDQKKSRPSFLATKS